jgi:ribonucleoside-triphosphate reductase
LRVNQSAFTNFSIFDRDYLIEIFGGKEFPDGSFIIDYIEDIIEYQKEFMRVVSEIRSQNMMTFPVLTMSLLRQKDGTWGDEDFARWCCLHNMKWADSNFFISDSVTSLSNCCRLLSDI